MSIYDKASLIQIPSGYRAGELYSVIPNSGVGDFTHTRNGTATRVNSQGLIETVNANVPRLDYPFIDGVVQDCPHLLLEPQRTNSLTYSEDFSQWIAINSTVLTNQSTAPDGSNNADKLTKNDAFGLISKFSVPISSGVAYSFSVFAKSDTGQNITIRQASGSNDVRFYFDLSTQVSGSTGGGNDLGFLDSKIEDFGNGWYRCTLVCTSNSNTGDFGFYAGRDGTTTYDGSIFIFGAQVEQGSYPTSNITTEGSAVTRLVDSCHLLNHSFFTDYPFTVYANAKVDAIGNQVFGLNNTASSSYYLFFSFANATQVGVIRGTTGANDLDYYNFSYSVGDTLKIAVVFVSPTAYKLYINGAEIANVTSGTSIPFNHNDISLGQFRITSDSGTRNSINEFMLFNEVLSDSELQILTTL